MALAFKSWMANEGPKHFIMMVWVGVNVFLFWRTFLLYYSRPQYYYLHEMLGLGLCISRASASVLNLNCSLVLLPMCRSVLTLLRGSQRVTSRQVRRLLDKSKMFHVTCGITICVFSVIHVSAHLMNMVNFSMRYSEDFPELNMAQYKGQDPRILFLSTVPGVTGVLLVIVLCLLCCVIHPCDVLEVRMLKSGFKPRPGQVTRFSNLLLTQSNSSEILPMMQQRRYPTVHVDGPFGSPSEEVFNYEVSLCVAGGIGVTPFACVLQALFEDWHQYKLKRLYFVWVCRDLQSFYWFADLLCGLHERNIGDERYRFLSSRLRIGRPKWKLLFQEIGRADQHKRVGVFCCGPKGISKALHTLCNSNPHSGIAFEYNKESFS
ncbi:NADPH oxidase 4 [Triplophysa tibetana]|uniref:NADPH oxidase 4 n=1 Tax=Triplophysa tibetana TaxID=1572043 RepID=A0A5A9MXA8_9TELE|nr:NADPH oxidase 4 [Triplophysa tibetana]